MQHSDPVSRLMKEHRQALRFEAPPSVLAVPRASRSYVALAASCAACLVIGVLTFQLGRFSERAPQGVSAEVVSGHVRSLMSRSHLADVISTDRHTVKPWFEGKLDFGVDVRDFSEHGFPLTGGRLDYIGGRPVAALVYQFGQHYINVYEWPEAGSNTTPRLSSDRGFQLFSWQKNGISYWVVSDVNAADLQSLANQLAN